MRRALLMRRIGELRSPLRDRRSKWRRSSTLRHSKSCEPACRATATLRAKKATTRAGKPSTSTPTPEMAQAVQAHLAYVAEQLRPYETGATYANFLELHGASTERVRAAYSPEDWERLVELKDRYDPGNLFRFNRNIPPSSAGR